MKMDKAIKKYAVEYSYLKKYPPGQINIDILEYLSLFVEDECVWLACLIQNPAGKTARMNEIKKEFGLSVHKCLKDLNRLHECEENMIEKFPDAKNSIVLFLANYAVIFAKSDSNRNFKSPDQKKARFALKLLENLDITDIRVRLEDLFFSLAEPGIYANYHSLLQFTKKKFLDQQKNITREFKKILSSGGINARIEARIKTIYSIHNKILKKNILFSQVLDTIGIRIMVGTEDDCYRSMVLILKQNQIMTSRVKDYIAIPKDNGYQSIHLTIFHEGHPVEIQIRTHEMHRIAQYGGASHFYYKSNARQGNAPKEF